MKASYKCEDLVKQFEGKKLESYMDSKGKWAIGYGQTGRHIGPGLRITDHEAEIMLKNALQDLQEKVTDLINVQLNQSQFDALVCFTYNVGIGAFSTSTLLKELNKGNFDEAANQLLRWSNSEGSFSRGLHNRRLAEYQLFKN